MLLFFLVGGSNLFQSEVLRQRSSLFLALIDRPNRFMILFLIVESWIDSFYFLSCQNTRPGHLLLYKLILGEPTLNFLKKLVKKKKQFHYVMFCGFAARIHLDASDPYLIRNWIRGRSWGWEEKIGTQIPRVRYQSGSGKLNKRITTGRTKQMAN
jgi:hypothetical protein